MAFRSAPGLNARTALVVFLLLQGGFTLEGTEVASAVDSTGRERTLHIVALGSLEGQFEACGCQPEPRGGLARRAGALAELRRRHEPILHLDLGNFSETREEVAELTNRFLWETLSDLGLDATTIGLRELEDWDLFQSLTEARPVPVISTNLFVTKGAETGLAAEPTHILEREGLRIGVVAVFDPASLSTSSLFQARDPATALEAFLPDLRQSVDLVILLSQLPLDETAQLLQDVAGIDVAFCPRSRETDTTRRVGRALVQTGGLRGQYFAHLTLHLNAAGDIVDFESESPPLDSKLPEDAVIARKVAEFRITLDRFRTEAQRREQVEFNALFERWRSASR